MVYERMKALVEDIREIPRFEDATRQVWEKHGEGTLSDAEAQSLAERLHERRRSTEGNFRNVNFQTVSHVLAVSHRKLFTPRRIPVSPDKLASRDRRRLLAYSGPMPPALAARFSIGELAVLRIVANEVIDKDVCDLCIDAIAGRAGVCRRLAQTTLRRAQREALLSIEERRNEGRRNSTNLVSITDLGWQAWTRHARKRKAATAAAAAAAATEPQAAGTGCNSPHPTDNQINLESEKSTKPLKKINKTCRKPRSAKTGKTVGRRRKRRRSIRATSDRTA